MLADAWTQDSAVQRYGREVLAASLQPVKDAMQAHFAKTVSESLRGVVLPEGLLRSLTGARIADAVSGQYAEQYAEMARAAVGQAGEHLAVQREAILRQIEQIRVTAVASVFQPKVSDLFAGPAFHRTVQQINQRAESRWSSEPEGIDAVNELIDAGVIDAGTITAAERAVSDDAELSRAADRLAELLAGVWPMMSRARARQVIVFLVWVTWFTVIVAATASPLGEVLPPELRAAPDVAGLGTAKLAGMAGEVFDKRFPPADDGQDDVRQD